MVSKTYREQKVMLEQYSPLEKALIHKRALEAALSGKMGLTQKLIFSFRSSYNLELSSSAIIYERISAQAHAPEFKGTQLPATFPTWARLVFLHMWLIELRFRYTSDPLKRNRMTRNIVDHCWQDIEAGIGDVTGSRNPLVISKYSKIYLNYWQGAALAYDVGTIKGDSSLTESLWRNLYEGSRDVPLEELALFTEYVRKEQSKLMNVSDLQLENGDFEFSRPPFKIPESEKLEMANEFNITDKKPEVPVTSDPLSFSEENTQTPVPRSSTWKKREKPGNEIHELLKAQYHRVLERKQFQEQFQDQLQFQQQTQQESESQPNSQQQDHTDKKQPDDKK